MKWIAYPPLDRLDKWLSRQEPSKSRSAIQRAIKENLITVNGKNLPSKYLLEEGDEINWTIKEEEGLVLKAESIPLDIVYEDNDILVVNKAAGMVVHPSKGHSSGTLVNALLGLQIPLSHHGEDFRPGIVHRLDKDTSGLMVIAKSDLAYDKLIAQIKAREVHRYYLALVSGIIEEEEGQIDAAIRRSSTNRLKRVADKEGQEAKTHFTVLERFKNASLVKCVLETGRTHQIRVHMAFINHPVLNDPMYGSLKIIPNLRKGQALHAYRLAFAHPVTGEWMDFERDLPEDISHYLNQLRRDDR
ncbi:RluA family pseudouridine synthase [Atopobacter sp. AH10]|uniref:RluA family pseudouridine synthase n=1 Tax=Atopobacter sp. AH10 TaxID=2315861 RepID=UPI000EF26C71|nr:RluA family pseudouridine synthase [Atopobacter sp. AH10]RLK63739.1 RluA family pseudouridine synthase [Atopobacter sp. AH10]